MVKDELSSVKDKLSKTLPSSNTQPPMISPVTERENVEPTQQPSLTTTASSVDSTTSSTVSEEEDSKASSTGEGRNTNVPTGEPTTPLTESTESRGTGATGDLPRTEEPVMVLNVSSEASDGGGGENSTESGVVATMEGVALTTTKGAPPLSPGSEEQEEEKNTNEQAIAALQGESSITNT